MSDNNLKITYKGEDIVDTDISTETVKTLKTSGKYCEADIIVTAQGGGAGNIVPLTVKNNGIYGALDLQEVEYLETDGVELLNIINYPAQGNYIYQKIVFQLVDISSADYTIVGAEGQNLTNQKSYINVWSPDYIQYANAGYQAPSSHTYTNWETDTDYTITVEHTGGKDIVKLDGTQVFNSTTSTLKTSEDIPISIGGLDAVVRGEKYLSKIRIKELEIFDVLNNTLVFKLVPMSDKTSPRGFVLNKVDNTVYTAPSGWKIGDFVEGGEEYTPTPSIGGYLPVTVNVESRLYGVPTSEFKKAQVSLNELDMSDEEAISAYQMYYQFYNKGINLSDFVYNGTTVGNYGVYYTFYGNSTNKNYIDVKMPNLTNVGNYGFSYAFYSNSNSQSQKIRDILIGNSNSTLTLGTYAFNYAFYGYNNIRDIIVRGLKSVTSNYAFYYAFRGATSGSNNCTIDGQISFPDLETISASNAFTYAFSYRRINYSTATVINPFPKLTTASGASCMSYAFQYGSPHKNGIFVFPKLKTFANASGTNQGNYMFQYAYNYWKYCWFLALEQIGGNVAVYSIFSNAWNGTKTDNCYQVCMPNLKRINSSSTATTATYGDFNNCNMMSKIWLPQLSEITGAAQQSKLFNNCTQSGLEIHFGIENETYIKSLTGYASKFGATNATIYFDCVNHITVNGTVYNRDGENYKVSITNETNSSTHAFTHLNDRYSWKSSGGAIVYTLECWTPAISDIVYDENDNIIGTIGAVS